MIINEKLPSFWKLFFTIRGSILPKVWKRVVYLDLLAVGVCVLYLHFDWHILDLSVAPFTIAGLVLGLFTGFRNNISYERYWEARTLWGSCLTTCRTLTRHIMVYGKNESMATKRYQGHLIIAFAHTMRLQLRGNSITETVSKWLPPEDAAAVIKSPNPANHILTLLHHSLHRFHTEHYLESPLMAGIDGRISQLADILGGCERIRTTPIPYAYLLLLHRSVYVYCILLPFGLVGTIGYMTPIVVSFMVYAFLGLDALGDEIANPFANEPNSLPLDSLCRNIEATVLAELGEPYPPPLKAQHGLLM